MNALQEVEQMLVSTKCPLLQYPPEVARVLEAMAKGETPELTFKLVS